MRDFAFIHSAEDVAEVLGLASDFSLIIRRDEPTPEPVPDIVDVSTISSIKEGLFDAYMKDWIFGDLVYNMIGSGYQRGMYDQRPSTNCVKIQFSFREERKDDRRLRLGNGYISRDIDWYDSDCHIIRPAPLEVKSTFDSIRKLIDTKKYILVGGRRYGLLKGALGKLLHGSYLPPFDFMDNERSMVD